MRPTCKNLLCAGVLQLCLNSTVHADDTPPSSYPEILVDDVKHVLTAPARWQEQEWRDMGLTAAGLVGVAEILDRPVRDEMRRHAPNNSRFLLNVERFGAEYSLFHFQLNKPIIMITYSDRGDIWEDWRVGMSF